MASLKNKFFHILVIAGMLVAALSGALTISPARAAAGPLCFVDASAGGANNGNSWADAYTDLQAALADLNCSEVWVAAGTYKPHASDRAVSFILRSGLALYGGFAGTETLLSQRDPAAHLTTLSGDLNGNDNANIAWDEPTRAENSYHVVVGSGTNASAVLDGFIVTGGNANEVPCPGNGCGGGMYNDGGSPTLTNVTFSGNSAITGGGGMYNLLSSPALTNVTFSGNSASIYGGGMSNTINSSPTLANVTFSNNSANIFGGGMSNDASSPTLTDVTFSGNSASNGGGMYNWNSSPTLTDVTFSGNSASIYGGGMYNFFLSNPTLTNVTFSGNSAAFGGGMHNDNSSNSTLTNVTFSGNSATINGGGMYNINSSPTLHQVIIADSLSGGDCVNSSGSLNAASSNNLIEDAANACGLTNGANGNIIGSDPMLGSLANNGGFTQTHALLPGSPAIDVVHPDSGCEAADQRGVTRPQGTHCDLGAYEYGPIIPLVTASNPGANAVLTSLSAITVVFNQDMLDDTSANGAENVNNYILVERGSNATFDTQSCAGGVVSDDIQQTFASVSYTNNGGVFLSTINLASPLTDGTYRLFVCGTTSIYSAAGLELNNGASDHTVDFSISGAGTGGTGGEGRSTTASALPNTGFASNKITSLPPQPAALEYAELGDLWLEVPSLNLKSAIVGVPQNQDNSWDVTWLGNDTGWLNGTAFPTWVGNSVLTAHVTNADGLPGPFAELTKLKYGDQIIVHMGGGQYIFEVRNSKLAMPYSTGYAFESLKEYSYLTLVTCQGFNPLNETYVFRRLVRAVLVSVK